VICDLVYVAEDLIIWLNCPVFFRTKELTNFDLYFFRFLVLNQQMVMLKEDLSYYGAVTLNLGETTYVHRPNVGLKTEEEKVLKYKIQAKWAT